MCRLDQIKAELAIAQWHNPKTGHHRDCAAVVRLVKEMHFIQRQADNAATYGAERKAA